MAIYLCHEQPELLEFEAEIIGAREGAVLLSRSALHPGGGGQVADRAVLRHAGGSARVVDVLREGDRHWHVLDAPLLLDGRVEVAIDAAHRARVAQLHTDTHILNALVFRDFAGALVTGAQIGDDGSARMDFDLPDADNDALRRLEPEINAIIGQAIEVRTGYVSSADAAATAGLVRSLSVAPPPTPDGRLRVVEIVGLDRQACGGTHLTNTAQSRPIRITKVENKGRRNRRVRIELA